MITDDVCDSFSPSSPLSSRSIVLTAADTLKISLTALEGKSGKRPHQAFLTFNEPSSGLEESFVFNVKDNGKAKIEVVCQKSEQERVTCS